MNLFPWLQDSISSINFDFLPHAIILEGVNGIGKKELGEFITLKILKTDTLNNHEQFVTQLTHPDLMKITDESIIKVDSIHSGIEFLNLSSVISKNRVLIIEDAEKMNKYSQNALLKTLEEPRDNSFLILQSNQSKSLNDTLYSRCRLIKIQLPNQVEKEKYLLSENIPTDKLGYLPSFMSPKKIAEIINSEQINIYESLYKNLLSILQQKDIHNSIQNVLKTQISFSEKLNFLIDFLKRYASSQMSLEKDKIDLMKFMNEIHEYRVKLFAIKSLNENYALSYFLTELSKLK